MQFKCCLKRFPEDEGFWKSKTPPKVAPQVSMTADVHTDTVRDLHLNANPAQKLIFLKGIQETFHVYFSFLHC